MYLLRGYMHLGCRLHFNAPQARSDAVACGTARPHHLQQVPQQHPHVCYSSRGDASASSQTAQGDHASASGYVRQGDSSSNPADFLEPFSKVDPGVRSDITSTSSSLTDVANNDLSQDVSTDKWGETLAVNHTLSSLYLRKVKVQPFQQLDLAERRRKRELQEICEAAAKKGIKADVIKANLEKLQGLVPGLYPNLDQMKASDWATVLKDVDGVVSIIITLKTAYPKVDVGKLIQRTPKLLLRPVEQIRADAQKVKSMLSRVGDIDAIIDAVPYLMDPSQLQQSLANLARWFPNQDPFDVLQKNPTMLVNIEEADLEADPLYGYDEYGGDGT